jgi:PAS domain S-box-containing protein
MSDKNSVDELTSALLAARIGPWDDATRLALLAAIVDSSDDAIVSKTLEGRILSWNSGATRIFGYTPEEVLGRPITVIIPSELHAEEHQILENLRAGRRIDHFDTVRLTKDGRRIPISLTVSPIRDSTGNVIGASKIARDISDRRERERLLLEREDALRAADRRKNEFLAVLAHELRNPLAPIRYALATMQMPRRSPEQERQAWQIIERQVAHMSRLLEDLLDVSRISRGNLALKKTRTELTVVLAAAIEAAQPMLNSKGHELTIERPDDEIALLADAVRLAQVFSNLLINAAKYTRPGGQIRLRARRERDEIIVAVRDNGIGMSAQLIPRLFNLFSQGQGARRDPEDGLGVGLALARTIVEMHGGRIEAHSQGHDRGSEFVVYLPLHEPASDTAERGTTTDGSAPGAGFKILVVDDNQDAADSCAAFLELAGHDVRTAYTGQRALEIAKELQPDVLVLDLGLPDISGLDIARTVRTKLSWGHNAVLIAATGWGQQEDRRRAFGAGFDHHLTKPVAPQAIESLLRSLGNGAQRKHRHAAQWAT